MSGSDPSGPVPDSPPQPERGGWSGLPWVWAVPIVALIIASWLGYRALVERGPTITISFPTAEGIEAGRTTIRYKEVELGHVTRVGLTPDRSRALVTAAMIRAAEPLLHAQSKFWVVRPRVGVGGISGLTTVLSGAYIGMLPGPGAPGGRAFAGLDQPPPKQGLVNGKTFTLIAKRLAEISDQSPVYYHGVQVGEVTGHNLSDRDGTVAVHIFVYAPHQALIHPDSRFWLASGLNVSVGAQGVKLATAPLLTIVAGGIVFDTPDQALAETPSPPGSIFELYADEKAANEAAEPVRVSYQLNFPGSVSGVTVGTPVNLRGLPIGEVTAVRLEYDPAEDAIHEPVTITVAPHRIKVGGRGLDKTSRNPIAATNRMFERLVAKGLRAQLVTANLLTGQRAIELDFVPGASTARMASAGADPELPTVESSGVNQVTRSADKLMSKLAALPLEQMVDEIRLMVGHADTLINRPDVKRSLHNLDLTLAHTARLTRTADIQAGPLLQRLNGAAEQLRATLLILGNDPAASNDLARTLGELKDAARSIRVLADYLERHPESLISGKSGEASR